MERQRMNRVLAVIAAAAFALPVAARSNTKDAKPTVSAKVDLPAEASIGGKRIAAGQYRVKADETTVTFVRDGKVVAEAAIHWKNEPAKSAYSAIVTEGGTLIEVHFNGKTRYAEISRAGTENAGQQ